MTASDIPIAFDCAQRDCDILNNSIVPFEEIQFLARGSSESNPAFVKFKEAQPFFTGDGRSLYCAAYHQRPVIVKKIEIPEPLPSNFTVSEILALQSGHQTADTYRLLREAIVGLALPRHPNLCQVMGWALPPEGNPRPYSFYIIMDRYNDDLARFIAILSVEKGDEECRPERGGPLGWEQFFFVATGLAAGLVGLSQARRGDGDLSICGGNIVHQDLKLANIFIDVSSGHEAAQAVDFSKLEPPQSGQRGVAVAQRPRVITKVVIGDFGCACREYHGSLKRGAGTLGFQAPEQLTCNLFSLSPQTDIFSFGMVLWRLLHFPMFVVDPNLNARARKAFEDRLISGKTEPKMSKSLPADIQKLIRDCCAYQPSDRPTANELLDRLTSTEAYRRFVGASPFR